MARSISPTKITRRFHDDAFARFGDGVSEDIRGDILVLGVGGKMGPTLARLARRAAPDRRVVGVARFSEPGLREKLESWGIECIAADLLDREAIARLPKAPNVIFMAGRKFGTSDREDLTWAMNTLVPAMVAETFKDLAIVAFSTGNVYPFVECSARRRDRGGCARPARRLRQFLRRP